MEVTDQADFLNAAAVFTTSMSPEKVAGTLQGVEKKLQKNIQKRFGPRTIDVDVLLYDQEILLDDKLTVPHLAMHERKFVLQPLVDLGAGETMHPGFDRTISDFLETVKAQKCTKTSMTLP